MIYGLYSAGGFARECLGMLRSQVARSSEGSEIVFIEDDESLIGTTYDGCRIVSFEEFCSFESKRANVPLAAPELRRAKVQLLEDQGIGSFTMQASNCQVGQGAHLAEGAILAPFSTLTCDLTIGRHFHSNIYSYVAHDCIIGDFVTLAPRVSINGRVTVGDGVYIGSDATILPGKPGSPRKIGEGAVIGAGAVVLRDVVAGETVVGNPARPLHAK